MGVCCGQVAYPKRTDKPLYHGLVTQLESCNIPFLAPGDITNGPPLKERFDVVIDAIFGFSFKGAPRPPFDAILEVCPLHIHYHWAVLPRLPLDCMPRGDGTSSICCTEQRCRSLTAAEQTQALPS